VGETGKYRLAQLDMNADTLRVIEREYTPLRVTEQERDSLLAEITELPPMLRVEAPEIPTSKAVFERIHLDPDGYVFVQLVGRPEDQGRLFDVFDPEGRYLGNIRSDIQFTTYRAPPVFTAAYVYGVTTDSLGVDYVVRARIERPE
jgi:hypothetical protein